VGHINTCFEIAMTS